MGYVFFLIHHYILQTNLSKGFDANNTWVGNAFRIGKKKKATDGNNKYTSSIMEIPITSKINKYIS